MDAAIPVDAKNAPTGIWKTAQNAVSHSAHTPHHLATKKKEDRREGTLINLSTDSDQVHVLLEATMRRFAYAAAAAIIVGLGPTGYAHHSHPDFLTDWT
jgi:hypothetical protein